MEHLVKMGILRRKKGRRLKLSSSDIGDSEINLGNKTNPGRIERKRLLGNSATSDSSFGNVSWTNTVNSLFTDKNAATAPKGSTPAEDDSEYLKVTKFFFDIPTDSEILGIKVYKRIASPGTQGAVTDTRARIVKGGVIGTEDKSLSGSWVSEHVGGGGVGTMIHGSKSDLWGEKWNAADINNNDFGFAFAANINRPGGALTATIYSIEIEVSYIILS